jgi:hypothetical protein
VPRWKTSHQYRPSSSTTPSNPIATGWLKTSNVQNDKDQHDGREKKLDFHDTL